MKKIVFESKNNAVLKEISDRLPNADEIRVKLAYSAISAGTERSCLTGNEEGGEGFITGFPASSGYSGSGIITHVGEGVCGFCVGDKVMVHGAGHQQFATLPVKEFVRLPENVALDEAALTVISGFSLAAIRKVQIEIGSACLVTGLGLLGLFAVQFAKLAGAYPVIASDFSAERRELALKNGADFALDPADSDYAEKVKKLADGGVRCAIEVTGNPKALKQTLACTAKFGKVALLGCTRTMTEVDFYHDVHWPGIQLIGAHSGARPQTESHFGMWTETDDCRVIVKYLSAGRIDFKDMISMKISPAEAHEIYEKLAFDKNFPIGVLFDWAQLQ